MKRREVEFDLEAAVCDREVGAATVATVAGIATKVKAPASKHRKPTLLAVTSKHNFTATPHTNRSINSVDLTGSTQEMGSIGL